MTAAEIAEADEAALRRAEPYAQVYLLRERSLSIGVTQGGNTDLRRKAAELDLPLVSRSSGGTAVVLGPGDLAWTLVLPGSHPLAGRGSHRAYGRLGRPVVSAFARHGRAAEWVDAPSLFPEVCLLSGRGQVLALEGRIVGGAAQHRTGRALLHHGMVHRGVDRELLARLYPALPASAADRLGGFGSNPPAPEPEALAETLRSELNHELVNPSP